MSQHDTITNRIVQDLKKFFPLVVLIGVYIIIMNLVAGKVCPMRMVSGFPCPGCGITRSLWLLCQGDIAGSIRIHPMGILIIPGMILGCYERYGSGSVKKWGQKYLIIWSIACITVYIIRMIYRYPHTEPMVYDSENLLQWGGAWFKK